MTEEHRRAIAHLRATVDTASNSISAALNQVVEAVDAALSQAAPPETANSGRLLTIDEAAEIIGLSRETVDKHARKGTLASVVLPSASASRPMRRFLASDLEAFKLRYRRGAEVQHVP